MNKEIGLVLGLVMLALIAGVGLYYVLDLQGDDGFVPASDQHAADADTNRSSVPDRARRAKLPAPKEPDSVSKREAGVKIPAPGETVALGVSDTLLEGLVVDGSGQPVAGALSMLFEDRSDVPNFSLQGDMFGLVETDDRGRFRFQGLPSNVNLLLRVDHGNFASWARGAMTLKAGATESVRVTLESGLSLRGEVQDSAGNPIAGAIVRVVDQRSRALDPTQTIERELETNASGQFEFPHLVSGIKKVTASAEGFATLSKVSINLNHHRAAKPLAFVLESGSRLLGRVVDQEGAPVVGALVSTEPVRRRQHSVPAGNYPSVKTDEQGEFVCEGLREGVYRVVASKKGFGVAKNQSARTGQEQVQIQMVRRPVIRGRVVDENGDPIQKFSIVLGREESLVFQSRQATQFFESETGEFEFIDLAMKSDFYAFAKAEGLSWSRSELIPKPDGDVDGLVIEMTKGATVTGRVTDGEGKPVAKARVTLVPKNVNVSGEGRAFIAMLQKSMRTASRRTTTDADGYFRVENVHEGNFVGRATHTKFAETEQEEAVYVDGKTEAKMPTLTLLVGGTIRGVVLESKKGVSGADCLVTISPKQGFGSQGAYTTRSDPKGQFSVANIRPGIYFVDIQERGGEQADLFAKMLMRKQRQEIMIADGEIAEVQLR